MYEFDHSKHLHMLDGKPLTGTTTVLQVVAKPMLIQWAANQAVDYIKSNTITTGPETSIIKNTVLDEAKVAHRKKKEAAGTWGTEVHSWVEEYSKACISGIPSPIPLEGVKGDACRHFIKWALDNKVTFKDSEKHVFSREMFVGGICDLVVEIEGKLWIADVKTGSGIYPEHFAQMSSYDMCLSEMGLYKDVAGYIVLNLRKDGSFEEKRSISNEDNRKLFLAALTIYRLQEKIKNQVIA